MVFRKMNYRWIVYVLAMGLLFVGSVSHSQNTTTIELTAQEILSRVDAVMRYPVGLLTGSLTHIMPDGRSSNFLLKGSISTDDYLFVVGSSERGDLYKILYNLGGEDIWVYRINSLELFHKMDVDRFESVVGTNFTYLDLSNADFQSNYNAILDGIVPVKGRECYRLQCEPIFKKGEYGRIVVFASKGDFIPLKIDYYDQDKVIIKSMAVSQTVDDNGRIFPVRYDMLHIRSGTLTILKFFKVDSKITFKSEMFMHQTLGQ